MALNLFASNQLERLSAQLISQIAEAQAGTDLTAVFEEQIILVPSIGLRDWLRQRIAEQLGICAGIRFCFPGEFISYAYDLAGLTADADDRLVRLRWFCLDALKHEPALADYLAEELQEPGTRSYHLAKAMSECFERYALYRPQETLAVWTRGQQGPWDQEATWQASLWRSVIAAGFENPLEKQEQLCQHLQQSEIALPNAIHAFGFNSISPQLLQILHALSFKHQMQMYSLQPTWGYWDDQRTRKQLLQEAAWSDTECNRLLGDWGAIGREFLMQLDDADALYHAEGDDFVNPGQDSLLKRLQHDAYAAIGPDYTEPINDDDRSLQFHACHSVRRQLEVIKEEIHRALAGDVENLQTHEIAIMCTDPEQIAPIAAAILGSDTHGPRLPYVIADRSQRKLNPAIEVFLRLLDLLPGRFTASDILDFIGFSPIARAWGLGSDELERLRKWIDDADLRWGVDAAHRKAETGHAYAAASWRHGLQRLQLAWWYGADTTDAKAFHAQRPSDSVVPVHSFQPEDFETLKRISLLLEPILEVAAQARKKADYTWWSKELLQLLQHVMQTQHDDADIAVMAQHLGKWVEMLDQQPWQTPMSSDLVRAHFSDIFSQEGGGDYARGAITICGLQPMRSVPFKMLCLVGMDDAVFPRQAQVYDFDLTRLHPRIGDRDLRREDRYLLLELLISVGERLCITYKGYDAQDNVALPAASIIGELADVALACSVLNEEQFKQRMFTHHRLHRSLAAAPWPDQYIYSERLALDSERHDHRFTATPLDLPALRHLDIEELVSFWRNPAKHYLQHLGVHVAYYAEAPRNHERFSAAAGLDRFAAAQRLLASSGDIEEQRERLAAEGLLAPGALGHYAWAQLRHFVQRLRNMKRDVLEEVEAQHVQCQIGDVSISGTIPFYHQALGVVIFHPGRMKAGRELDLWIRVLHAAASGLSTRGRLFTIEKNKVKECKLNVKDAQEHLSMLVEGMEQGRRALIPFVEAGSELYIKHLYYGRTDMMPNSALKKAETEWLGQGYRAPNAGAPESEHPAHVIAWPGAQTPMRAQEFKQWAERIWHPIKSSLNMKRKR